MIMNKEVNIMKQIENIRQALETYNYVGIRGLSGLNATKKYRVGQILAQSYDDWDGRGVEYKANTPKLHGTSAIAVNSQMDDDEILEAIEEAKKYSDNSKIALIAGDYATDGADSNEIVISVTELWTRRGARFLGYL